MKDEIKIGNEDRATGLEKAIMDIFDRDWKEFVKHIKEKNRASNYRLLKIIAEVKGLEYLNALKRLMKRVSVDTLITFSNEKSGTPFKQVEWAELGEVYFEQHSTADGMVCNVYIPIKPGKYLHLIKHL